MADQKFTKDTDYGRYRDDFAGEDELFVTITLHEYRELVKAKAVRDYEQVQLMLKKDN